MKSIGILFTLLFMAHTVFSQKTAYVIYNAKGKKVTYEKMIQSLAQEDIVLFGELHNNPISHWLQYEVTSDLYSSKPIILGAEMFEADNQRPLNDYLNLKINHKELDSMARLWPNYKTDYAPLVDFAKEKQLTFVATNIPRRYANKVYKKGFEALDSLSEIEKEWMAPLPISFDAELSTYKNILVMMGDHGT
ncbi:MAG: ChaN family lipoprotein, partial [Bacteroidetes bacterium]|nr:ChaN family lipoprotein [Bacteroidota bacterium]